MTLNGLEQTDLNVCLTDSRIFETLNSLEDSCLVDNVPIHYNFINIKTEILKNDPNKLFSFISNKCTKLQFIHALTAKCSD